MEPLYPTATATAVETGKGIVTQQYVPVVLLVPSVLLVYLSLILREKRFNIAGYSSSEV